MKAYASAGLTYPVVAGEAGADDALLKSFGDEALVHGDCKEAFAPFAHHQVIKECPSARQMRCEIQQRSSNQPHPFQRQDYADALHPERGVVVLYR
jgi:hypothetical protein